MRRFGRRGKESGAEGFGDEKRGCSVGEGREGVVRVG